MCKLDAEIVSGLEQLLRVTGSDFAGIGLIDETARRLRWRFVVGSISQRTLNVAQKPSVGLSGAAMRSGRPAKTEDAQMDAESFWIGEPLMLSEQLRSAAAIPMGTDAGPGGVMLLGRRSVRGYDSEELDLAVSKARELAIRLLELQYR
jgi:nitrogen regulatory protein A